MSDKAADDQQLTVHFQIGLDKETMAVTQPLDLDPILRSQQERWVTYASLKESAIKFIQKKHPDQKLSEIFLFLHQPQNPNFLKLIVPQMDVPDGSVVEVVKINFSIQSASDETSGRPHSLNIHSYKSPHFCEFCGEMLWGLVKQGLKCEACGLNYHKRCAYKLQNDCQATRGTSVLNSHASNCRRISLDESVDNMRLSANYSSPLRRGSYASQASRCLQIPHSFLAHTFNLPTVCQLCHRLLPLLRQNLQCKDCKFNCHKKCADFVPNNCMGESKSLDGDLSDGAIQEAELEDGEVAELNETGQKLINYTANKKDSENLQKNLVPTVSNNIPLQRVVQSFKNTKKADGSQILRADWLISYTNKDTTKRRHYWKLEPKMITLFTDENSNRYYKEIVLTDITRLEMVANADHVFELVVKEIVFCVGGDKMATESTSSDQSTNSAVCFEKSIRQAMLPLNNNQSNFTEANGSLFQDKEKITDISQRYEIFPEEILGSGQFGIVYGAIHKFDKHAVAIKVIDKLRFPNKQEAQLKNEVSILQNIHHPGVVNLEYMFETPDKIYVVMEKLQGDMLEMILGNPKGRLCERVTRFIVSQILIALKDLHQKHIVHCDLKPENVLLSSHSSFPLVKLCDFGFAKIIGEKSFRRSVVGTPAYLAPEVLKNKGYNRSLDMWSVGVILYVSLSGTFPFNEDEDINEQIQNADFMFPANLWSAISKTAIDLITRILQVHFKTRYTVDRSLNHEWLQNYQCFSDLRLLEHQVGQRYLTAEADESRWETFRQLHKLPPWSEYGMRPLAESQRL